MPLFSEICIGSGFSKEQSQWDNTMCTLSLSHCLSINEEIYVKKLADVIWGTCPDFQGSPISVNLGKS